MYKLKKEIQEQKKWGNNRKLAKITGISESFISEIFAGRCIKEKVYAYAIAKAISNENEIENIFEII